jgi:hypothetical protein
MELRNGGFFLFFFLEFLTGVLVDQDIETRSVKIVDVVGIRIGVVFEPVQILKPVAHDVLKWHFIKVTILSFGRSLLVKIPILE